MKLATLRNGRPDGHLVVVSKDLTRCVSAGRVAPTLQAVLDDWERAAPALAELAQTLDRRGIAAEPFDAVDAMAPLPRAYAFIDGAAYPSHLERAMVQGQGEAAPKPTRPTLYRGASDRLLGAHDPIVVPEADLWLDFEAEIAVITGPVVLRPDRAEALAAIRLVTVCNDISLRKLVVDDLEQGFGFFHAKPATAFAPVAVTPDELGPAWRDAKLHLPVRTTINTTLFGQPNAGRDMQYDFADLIAAAAQTHPLGAGTIIASGTVSNRHTEAPPIRRDGIGFASIAEARAVEKARYGRARTPFLKPGDRVRIAAIDTAENPVFGAIDQSVEVRAR